MMQLGFCTVFRIHVHTAFIFITQRYTNQVEKAIFSPRFFGTHFLQKNQKSLGTKNIWGKSCLLDQIRVALGNEYGLVCLPRCLCPLTPYNIGDDVRTDEVVLMVDGRRNGGGPPPCWNRSPALAASQAHLDLSRAHTTCMVLNI